VNFAPKNKEIKANAWIFLDINEEKQCLIILLSVATVWKTYHRRFKQGT